MCNLSRRLLIRGNLLERKEVIEAEEEAQCLANGLELECEMPNLIWLEIYKWCNIARLKGYFSKLIKIW